MATNRVRARERVTQAGSAELQNAREQRPQLCVLHNHLRPPTLGNPQSDEAMELISFFARQRHPDQTYLITFILFTPFCTVTELSDSLD